MTAPIDAHETALRLLAASDHGADSLTRALVARGATAAASTRVVEALVRTGVVDDARLAALRAETLAARGKGDLAIAADLEARGLASDTVLGALAGLAPEVDRAREVIARRGRGAGTVRLLQSRGFTPESVELAVAVDADPWLP